MSRVRVAVIIVLGLVVFTLPFKRSWLLRADNQPTLQYTVLGAFDLASASVGSPSLYSVLRVTWQKLVGLDPSLLLWALELACIYRLTLLLFNWQIATVTTLLSNLPGLLLTPLGWTAYYSWLCLLSTVLTLMLWQISHRKVIERQVFLLASWMQTDRCGQYFLVH